MRAFEDAAARLGIGLLPVPIRDAGGLGAAIEDAARRRADGFAHVTTLLLGDHEEEIVASAEIHRLATIFEVGEAVEAGGLMSCGPDRVRSPAAWPPMSIAS